MLSRVATCTLLGIEGHAVYVETSISGGLPNFYLVGLAAPAVKEARERVRAAVKNCGLEFPSMRITVNLAPADLKKDGSLFDVAIALGILTATGQLPDGALDGKVFVGELSLDGQIRRIPGAMAIASSLKEAAENGGVQELILPRANALEASLAGVLPVKGVAHLNELVAYLRGERSIEEEHADVDTVFSRERQKEQLDFSEVRGHLTVKRALEISAAGGHNVLLTGPPGTGKTMLARRMPSIMPSMTMDECLEVTTIHSVAGLLAEDRPLITSRPFRSPHHSATPAGILGGGRMPRPGEVSLAHLGVLFLDEFPEYSREVLEGLRQPLEDGEVIITRNEATIRYTSRFMLIASRNPCPCGYYLHPRRECRCSEMQVRRYRVKSSGPLMDRIDLHVDVPSLEYREIDGAEKGESSAAIRQRVERARQRQRERMESYNLASNAAMSHRHLQEFCPLDRESRRLLRRAFDSLGLSMRAHDRIIKVARTIADLEGLEQIAPAHVAEAIQYRSLDRDC